MTVTNRNMRSAVAMLASALLAGPVHAQQKWPHMPTAAEVAVMPEYCRAKMGTDASLEDVFLTLTEESGAVETSTLS